MAYLRYGLVLISLFQFMSSLVIKPFYLLIYLCNLVIFQLRWYYIDNRSGRITTYIFNSIMILLLIYFIQLIPNILIVILAFDVFMEWPLSKAIKIIVITSSIFFILAYAINIPDLINSVTFFLSSLLLIGWGSYQSRKIHQLEELQYENILKQELLIKERESISDEMVTMRDVYVQSERTRISRDMHDSIGHVLSTILVQLNAISKISENDSPQASIMSRNLANFTKDGLEKVRAIIHNLKPHEYEKLAFIDILQERLNAFEELSRIKVVLHYNEVLWILNDRQQDALLYVIQEFLTNTNKHSQGTEVRIHLHYLVDSLIITLQDNGVGSEYIKYGGGLAGIKERIHLLGGEVHYNSKVDLGFRTRIVLRKEELTID